MRRVSSGLLAVLILASACVPTPAVRDVKKANKVTAASAKPKPGATSAGAAPLALDPARLLGGAGTVPLGGSVLVDASYMVAAGAGNVLSHNGGQIVAAGGGNILSHNGGQMVAAGGLNMVAAGGLNMVAAGAGNLVAAGGQIVAAGAGNIVAAGGGNMVAAGAGNLVGPDGGSLVAAGAGNMVAAGAGNMVAAGAGNLVAAGAGNLVAAGAGNLTAAGAGGYRLAGGAANMLGLGGGAYRVAQAAPPVVAAPAYGTQLPAAGMLVWVKSLATGNPVSLGLGPDGNAVWAVFTDAAGRYDLHVPADQRNTLMVVAEVPFRNDRRTGYGMLTAKLDGKGMLDEDEALLTRYMRLAARARFDHYLAPVLGGVLSDEAALTAIFGQTGNDEKPLIDPFLQSQLLGKVRELDATIKANPKIKTAADYRFVVEEMANVLLSDRDAYDAVTLAPLEVEAYLDKYDADDDAEEIAIVAELRNQNPLYKAAMVGDAKGRLPAIAVLKAILAETREAVRKLGPAGARAFAKANPFVAGANAFHAKYDPKEIPRPYYSFDKATDLADFAVTEYLAHPINAPYGCRGAECETAYLRKAPWTGCGPDSLPSPCLPAAGVRELRTTHLLRFLRSVFKDVGILPSHADLLYAAGEQLATASLGQILLLQPQLHHVICRYGKGATSDCPVP